MRKLPIPARLGEEYKGGASTSTLREMYGMSQPTLLRMLDELGVERRPKSAPVDEIPGIGKEYDEGATIAELKRKYRIGYATLTAMIDNQGVKLREIKRRSPISPETAKKIKAEYKEGNVTVKELATKYSHSYDSVYGMMSRDPDVEMRRPGKAPNDEPILGLKQDYLAGEGLKKLAKRHKRGKDTIRQMLVDEGVTIRSQGSHK